MPSLTSIWNPAARLLLAALVFLAFGGALRCGFVWFDDHGYVYENAMVAAGLTRAGIRWAFTTAHMYNRHPLTWLSHMADVELYGLWPAGHHLTSLLLHAANALLVFGVLRRATGRAGPAWFAAALWAAHPLRAESVVWISERKDVLAALFGLAALRVHLGGARRGPMAGVAALFAASLLAKPTWITLPFLLLLLDVWPLGRPGRESAWGLVREKASLWLLAAAAGVATFSAQAAGGAVRSAAAVAPGLRLANAATAYVRYLRATLWPVDLAVFYPLPADGVPAAAWLGALALLAGLTAAAWRLRRRLPGCAVGWLWFLGALVPMLGLVQVGGQAWADRYSYLPHIGLALALAAGAEPWRRRLAAGGPGRRRAAAALAAVPLAALVALARAQTATWRDTETLFRHALAATQNNWRIHFNLANRYQLDGRLPEACAEYRATLRIVPNYAAAMDNLARAQAAHGDVAAARATAREALALAERTGNVKLAGQIRRRLGYHEGEVKGTADSGAGIRGPP